MLKDWVHGLIYNWFEVGLPILETPNLGAQIQEMYKKENESFV